MRVIILNHSVSCFHFHLRFAQSRRTFCIFGHSLFWKRVLGILKSVIWLPSWETQITAVPFSNRNTPA